MHVITYTIALIDAYPIILDCAGGCQSNYEGDLFRKHSGNVSSFAGVS